MRNSDFGLGHLKQKKKNVKFLMKGKQTRIWGELFFPYSESDHFGKLG